MRHPTLAGQSTEVLGLWVIISPWVLGFDGSTMAMSNSVIVGVLLVATALGAVFVPRAWEEWTEAGIGLWLSYRHGSWASAAIAMPCSARWLPARSWRCLQTLFTDKDYSAAWREPMAH